MRTLYDETFTNLNISSEQELAQFTVTGQHVALIVMINIENLSGNSGEYAAKLRIDDKLVVPDRKIAVDAGNTSISIQSRDIVLYENGILKISLQGLAGDVNINGRLIVIDTSPVTIEEVSSLISDITPEIIDAVESAIGNMNVTVKPETKVLGACQKQINSSMKPLKQPTVSMPQVKKC